MRKPKRSLGPIYGPTEDLAICIIALTAWSVSLCYWWLFSDTQYAFDQLLKGSKGLRR